jgi:hypothetical protein
MASAKEQVIFLPDTRGVVLSRYGKGNLKIGADVFTYSKLPGNVNSCPGSTSVCEVLCYAKRIRGIVRDIYEINTQVHPSDVPPIPAACKLLRLHVSGDFDTVQYIDAWIARLTERPDVTCWAYTRSWRVAELLPALERLRALPNMQLFASVDYSSELPPTGWRRAWIQNDRDRHRENINSWDGENHLTIDGTMSYVCPEELGTKENCQACGYCLHGKRNDVTFIEHGVPVGNITVTPL